MTPLERAPREKEFDPIPADGSQPAVNPPPIRWLPHDGIARWLVELTGPDGETRRFGPLRDPILALRKKLTAGSWRWQFVGLDAAGSEAGRSNVRTFTVRRGLPGFVVPDARRCERLWRDRRPRLFAERIALVRSHLNGEFAEPFRRLLKWCELAKNEPPIPDPAGYGPFPSDSEENNADWIRIYSDGRVATANAVRYALAYMLTDDRGHLAQAKRWAMNCLEWNPWGTTSLHTCDEAGMPLIERLALVYDWLHPHWTAFEHERFREVMLIRVEEARERDRQVCFAASPFYNHQCRTLAFTGLAGIAFLGEIPQAAEWLQYVLDIMAVSYPSGSWGSDDGGWAQGPSYWSAYMSFLVSFIAAAAELDIRFAAAPYYRNTGYFAVYTLPPYAPAGGFGDAAYGPPGFNHKLVVGSFGEAARDGHLRAYADAIKTASVDPEKLVADPAITNRAHKWDGWTMTEVLQLLLSPGPGLEPASLRTLPPARLFPYIGSVAFHSALGDAERDAWLLFKSGPFGSVSHSHADQNSFQVYAYGQPLLIDSGYYPWYDSPHDTLWTRQSWAHNMVLVGGRGQPAFDWFARGRVESFADAAPFGYARGEAVDAYNRAARHGELEMARKHCPELAARMAPATQVKRASRSVLMVNAERPCFVVLDWIETADPVQFQWLAHAAEEMQVGDGGFGVVRGPARLSACFAWPRGLTITQTDAFPVEPEARAKGSPKQWHLSAETSEPATTARFLTVLAPHRADEEAPQVERLDGDSFIGARVGETVILAPRSGVVGPIAFGGIEAQAAALVIAGRSMFAAEALKVTVKGRTVLESVEPATRVLKGTFPGKGV